MIVLLFYLVFMHFPYHYCFDLIGNLKTTTTARSTTTGSEDIRQCASAAVVLLSSTTGKAAVSRRRYQEVLSPNLRYISALIFRFSECFGFFIVVDFSNKRIN